MSAKDKETEENFIERRAVQKDCVQCIMGTNFISGLLSSIRYRSYNIYNHENTLTFT